MKEGRGQFGRVASTLVAGRPRKYAGTASTWPAAPRPSVPLPPPLHQCPGSCPERPHLRAQRRRRPLQKEGSSPLSQVTVRCVPPITNSIQLNSIFPASPMALRSHFPRPKMMSRTHATYFSQPFILRNTHYTPYNPVFNLIELFFFSRESYLKGVSKTLGSMNTVAPR